MASVSTSVAWRIATSIGRVNHIVDLGITSCVPPAAPTGVVGFMYESIWR
jgi:hypothetical protein